MSDNKPSVILMGSKPGSVVALKLMLARNWDVRYVVVTRDEKHPWVQGPSLKEYAEANGLRTILQSELPRDLTVDFVLSYMFRLKVKPDVLAMAKNSALNFHAGPLPEFGGWAFYNIAILEDSLEYGCTCHHMDDGFDTGPLMKVNRFPIDPKAHTAVSLERMAQQEMIRLFVDFLDLAESGQPLPRTPQDPAKMRYLRKDEFMALKRLPEDGDADTLEKYARAFWYPPYDCAYTYVGQTKVDVVPKIAKEHLATLLQSDSLDDLELVAVEYSQSEHPSAVGERQKQPSTRKC